jgi:glucose-6-phosphate isomerase
MLQQSFDLALESGVGKGGIPDAAFEQALADLAPALARLTQQAKDGSLPLLTLPGDTADLPPVKAAAERLKAGATDILVLGTGGSSLGGQTLAQLTGYGIAGRQSVRTVHLPCASTSSTTSIPATYAALLAKLPLKTTKFVAISKSGGTGETLLQSDGGDRARYACRRHLAEAADRRRTSRACPSRPSPASCIRLRALCSSPSARPSSSTIPMSAAAIPC